MCFDRLNRRELLIAFAGLAACKKRASRFNGYAFVANAGSRSVAVVNLSSFSLVREIPLAAPPSAVLSLSNPARVIALTPNNGEIAELDCGALGRSRKLRIAPRAISMRASADARSLWVLCGEPASLVRVDLAQWRVASRTFFAAIPSDFDISETHAVVALPSAHAAAVVDLKSGKTVRSIAADCTSVRFAAKGAQVITANSATRVLSLYETAGGQLLVTLPLALSPRNFCLNTDGGQLFLTGEGMDGVAIVSPYQTQVAETILAGHTPGSMAVTTSQPEYLFVANSQSGDVSVIDVQSRRLVAQVPVGEDPAAIAITPDNAYALVANRRSGDLAVIRVSTFAGLNRRTRSAPLFTLIRVGSQPGSIAICAL